MRQVQAESVQSMLGESLIQKAMLVEKKTKTKEKNRREREGVKLERAHQHQMRSGSGLSNPKT